MTPRQTFALGLVALMSIPQRTRENRAARKAAQSRQYDRNALADHYSRGEISEELYHHLAFGDPAPKKEPDP